MFWIPSQISFMFCFFHTHHINLSIFHYIQYFISFPVYVARFIVLYLTLKVSKVLVLKQYGCRHQSICPVLITTPVIRVFMKGEFTHRLTNGNAPIFLCRIINSFWDTIILFTMLIYFMYPSNLTNLLYLIFWFNN